MFDLCMTPLEELPDVRRWGEPFVRKATGSSSGDDGSRAKELVPSQIRTIAHCTPMHAQLQTTCVFGEFDPLFLNSNPASNPGEEGSKGEEKSELVWGFR